MVAEIYGEYVSSIGEKIGEVDAALAAYHWPRMDKIAHTVKGNALAAGDSEMAETAISLRKAAALEDAALAAPLVEEFTELATSL